MAVNIALSEEKLAQLMRAGNLHPSELVCLDKATRDTIKNLCLQLCSQTKCHQCALNGLCGQEVRAMQPHASLLKLPGLVNLRPI